MIPLTVSFFLKGAKSKQKGLRDAFIYGLAIIGLYTGMGTAVTAIWGADALNALASNAWFNLGLAALLVVFAFSFFGYFEIQLPDSWADKTDAVADKGGIIGILAMAATLAIVSFSCTGPLIGVLLVDTVTQVDAAAKGIPLEPIIGMLGFSVALALPFGLFAAFPAWLSSLPKSGSWMDDLKVSVGFIEVALALKFLAVFSLLMENSLGFKILPYEAFVGLWVVIALLWGLYFFNKLRFPHTPKLDKVPVGKIVLGALCLALAGYNAMGFQTRDNGIFKSTWLMSGLAPPACHSYITHCECPQGVPCHHDYFVAKDIAKQEGKPLLIDFTGYACENCRKNEDNVWPQEGIIELLMDDYIIASLYVDDSKKLAEPYVSEMNGKRRKEGQKWADFQISHMGSNAQPLYVLANVGDDGIVRILNKPMGNLISEPADFQAFLECGLERHNALEGK
jgi:thiol:disulfide interchange protein DsbD